MRPTRAPLPGLLIIGLGASIAPMDFAVNVAFPAISAAFALDVQSIRWVVICYVITYASLMLAFGKLGDIAGHRSVFRAGLLTGTLAFAACGHWRKGSSRSGPWRPRWPHWWQDCRGLGLGLFQVSYTDLMLGSLGPTIWRRDKTGSPPK